MRPWNRVRRLVALLMSVIFLVGVLAVPAEAKSRSFSSSRSTSSFKSSGSRSFSTPKVKSTPSTPSRSFSTPKPSTTPAPSRSVTTPKSTTTPSPSYSSPSAGNSYSSSTSPSYSSGSRSYSSESRSFSSQRSIWPFGNSSSSSSTGAPKVTEVPSTPQTSYDRGQTKHPSMPPVVVYGDSPFGGTYWHDYYWGQPLWWRMFHRPVYYSGTGFAVSWVAMVGALVLLWILLGVLSAMTSRRRRHR